MKTTVILCIAASLGGILTAVVSYLISQLFISKKADLVSVSFVIRQFLQIAYLAGAYFVCNAFGGNIVAVLICTALGLTVPSVFLTSRLIKKQSAPKEDKEVK